MVNLVSYAFNFEVKPIFKHLQKEEMPIDETDNFNPYGSTLNGITYLFTPNGRCLCQ